MCGTGVRYPERAMENIIRRPPRYCQSQPMILACCILHNICILRHDERPEDQRYLEPPELEEEDDQDGLLDDRNRLTSRQKREVLW